MITLHNSPILTRVLLAVITIERLLSVPQIVSTADSTLSELSWITMAPRQFISQKDITEAEQLLDKLKFSKAVFSPLVFSKWEQQRKKSIDTIDKLQKKLDNIYNGCNAAYTAGSVLEIAGGITTIVGTILSIWGNESADQVIKGGEVCNAAGTFTTFATTLADAGLTSQVINEVKLVLAKDEEYTKSISTQLEYSRKLDACLTSIFNCSVLSDNFLDVVKLCSVCIPLLRDIRYEASNLIKQIQSRKLKNADISEYTEATLMNVCITLKNICMNKNICQSVLQICKIIQASPTALGFAKFGLQASFQICNLFKVNILANFVDIPSTSSGAIATGCILNTIQVGLSLLGLITTIKNIEEGQSKYSKALENLKLALAMELNTLHKNYSTHFDKKF
ncbi:uncharacterized protein CDAR_198651 [Caerostris darwini]|uniref:Uncharacterized protein n=1 Tax=Caerostris darwini TaxID=1538125 RepID=A0AAV4W3H7_9ARAC|nr:uncharacterized protein CDAR_198651 [Caerostris darwini]